MMFVVGLMATVVIVDIIILHRVIVFLLNYGFTYLPKTVLVVNGYRMFQPRNWCQNWK